MDDNSYKKNENSEFAKIFEQQVEENNSLRDAIKGLINQNPDANSFILEERDRQIDQANEKIDKLTQRCIKVEKKYKETKTYYNLFRHTQLIQCKYCNKYYKSNDFVAHCETWSVGGTLTHYKVNLSSVEISITQTLIREDENMRKPFTMYVIESTLEGDTWSAQRKYKEFWLLNERLINNFPSVTFPQSANQFCSKSLWDVLKKKKNTLVEQRRKNLQNYLNDLAQIAAIRDCDYFKDFIEYKWASFNKTCINEINSKQSLDELSGNEITLKDKTKAKNLFIYTQ